MEIVTTFPKIRIWLWEPAFTLANEINSLGILTHYDLPQVGIGLGRDVPGNHVKVANVNKGLLSALQLLVINWTMKFWLKHQE
jgi:hypothetical protein